MAAGVTARPGVVETIKAAQGAGDKLALVTTTARENVDVEEPKPDKSAYTPAL